MNSDTLQGTIFVIFILALITIVCTFKMVNDDREYKLAVAYAQAGLVQKCDKSTDFNILWVKP